MTQSTVQPPFTDVGCDITPGYTGTPYTLAGGNLLPGYLAPAYTDAGGDLIGYIPPNFTDVGGDLFEPLGTFTVVLDNLFSPSIYALSDGEQQLNITYDLTSEISVDAEFSNAGILNAQIPFVVSVDSIVIPFDQMTIQAPITFAIDMNTGFTPVLQINGVLRIRF